MDRKSLFFSTFATDMSGSDLLRASSSRHSMRSTLLLFQQTPEIRIKQNRHHIIITGSNQSIFIQSICPFCLERLIRPAKISCTNLKLQQYSRRTVVLICEGISLAIFINDDANDLSTNCVGGYNFYEVVLYGAASASVPIFKI